MTDGQMNRYDSNTRLTLSILKNLRIDYTAYNIGVYPKKLLLIQNYYTFCCVTKCEK